MIEDKLNEEQRIRLECLAQSVAQNRGSSLTAIVNTADKFEDYVLHGKKEDEGPKTKLRCMLFHGDIRIGSAKLLDNGKIELDIEQSQLLDNMERLLNSNLANGFKLDVNRVPATQAEV